MLFKKKKGAPTPIREQSPEARESSEKILKKLQSLQEETEGLRSHRDALQRRVIELEQELEQARAEVEAATAAPRAATPDPFAVTDGMDAQALRSVLDQLDRHRSLLLDRLRSTSVPDGAAKGETRTRLLERLAAVDEIFADDVAALQSQAKEGLSEAELEAAVVDFEAREDAKRQELLEKLKTWKSAGIVTAVLEKAGKGTLLDLSKRFVQFEEMVIHLDRLSTEVAEAPLGGGERTDLQVKLKDPANIAEIERALASVRRRREESTTAALESRRAEEEAQASARAQEELAAAAARHSAAQAAAKHSHKAQAADEGPRAPREHHAPEPHPAHEPPAKAPPAEPAAASAEGEGGEDSLPEGDPVEVATSLMAAAQAAMTKAEAEGKNVKTAAQMVKLASTFMRTKKYDKAATYADKALKMLQR